MKNKELIEKLKTYPGEINVCIYDWERNAREDIGDGSSDGIYSDFEVDKVCIDEENEKEFWKEQHDADFQPWVALGFKNEYIEQETGPALPSYEQMQPIVERIMNEQYSKEPLDDLIAKMNILRDFIYECFAGSNAV